MTAERISRDGAVAQERLQALSSAAEGFRRSTRG